MTPFPQSPPSHTCSLQAMLDVSGSGHLTADDILTAASRAQAAAAAARQLPPAVATALQAVSQAVTGSPMAAVEAKSPVPMPTTIKSVVSIKSSSGFPRTGT